MKKILLVDDESDVREILADILQDMDFTVTECESVESAIKEFDYNDFDIVISDIRMPDESGIDLARKIRERNKNIPIVFVSGYNDATPDELRELKVSTVVQKPYKQSDIAEALKKI